MQTAAEDEGNHCGVKENEKNSNPCSITPVARVEEEEPENDGDVESNEGDCFNAVDCNSNLQSETCSSIVGICIMIFYYLFLK